MPASFVITCERTPCWAVAWRRALGKKLRVIETRTIAGCLQELESYSASIVSLETTSERAAELGLQISQWRERFPQAAFVPVGDESLRPWELYFREAGAWDIIYSRRQIPKVAATALRHSRRFTPPPPAWRQAIWNKLPWSEGATPAPIPTSIIHSQS